MPIPPELVQELVALRNRCGGKTGRIEQTGLRQTIVGCWRDGAGPDDPPCWAERVTFPFGIRGGIKHTERYTNETAKP